MCLDKYPHTLCIGATYELVPFRGLQAKGLMDVNAPTAYGLFDFLDIP